MPYEITVDRERGLIEIHVMGETNPLEALAKAANDIGQGNLKTTIPIRGLEETAVVGTARTFILLFGTSALP